MKKISDLARPENRFYTVDGVALNTAQDLFKYVSECTAENFASHVNEKKNDFANWTRDVLKLPMLASKLEDAGTIETASDVLLDHFKMVDKYVESIDPKKYFITVDGYGLKDVLDLYYYIANCDDENFKHHESHVVDGKNDFVRWTDEVLNLHDLASKLQICNNRVNAAKVLSDFLINEHPLDLALETSKNSLATGIVNDAGPKNFIKGTTVPEMFDQEKIQAKKVENDNREATVVSSKFKPASSTSFSTAGEESIDLTKRPKIDEREEEPDKNTDSIIPLDKFKQFSDEELEHFVKFSRPEKIPEDTAKIEYLKYALQELKTMIQDLRRAEKDPLVADLLLRTVNSKIEFYALSKDVNDYNRVIRLMKEAQREIEECSTQTTTNLAQELLKDLRLSGIIMKKS
jgi:hypothetical protein